MRSFSPQDRNVLLMGDYNDGRKMDATTPFLARNRLLQLAMTNAARGDIGT